MFRQLFKDRNGKSVLLLSPKDPTYSTGKFGEIKELILGMLDTYNYEKVGLLPFQEKLY